MPSRRRKGDDILRSQMIGLGWFFDESIETDLTLNRNLLADADRSSFGSQSVDARRRRE